MPEAVKINPTPVPSSTSTPNMAELAKQLLDLQKQVNEKAAKAEVVTKAEIAPPAKLEIDWAKIEEKDVFDFTMPIPAIEQEIPDYLNLHTLDKNYITRWVHKLPERLGVCLVSGYSYLTKDEVDPAYPLAIQPDVEGHFSYSDVVCLKILKSRYYPAIRKNHEKSMSIHGRAKIHSKVGQQVANSNPKLESALRRGAISFYDEEATEESGPDLESVTL